MKSNHIYRSYRLSIPSGYNKSSAKTWPLIVDFHGRGGSAESQWNNSQYYLNPTGQNFFVVYPNGCVGAPSLKHPDRPERAWQGAPYANKSCNDLLFVSDLVGRIQANYNIDSARIFASGKSNGGGFVDTLACSTTGDLFAAFAMASAALYTDNETSPEPCIGHRPRMILESHGTEDHIIPFLGPYDPIKPNYAVPDISHWTHRWAERNHCARDEDRIITHESWGTNITHSCKDLTNNVQQYRVTGLGHCWPTLGDNKDSYNPKHNCSVHTLDFTQAVLDFFAKSSKAA